MDTRQRWGWIAHLLKACMQQHHPELEPFFAAMIPVDGVVLDIGAHAGQFAKLFAKIARNGQVYAFEPSPYALSILRPALTFNRLRNVHVLPYGLAEEAGDASLATPIKRRGDLGFGIAHLGKATDLPSVSFDVRLTTIDAACRDFQRLDFIKIDIEGWELSALRGGAETLRRFRPAIWAEVDAKFLARAGAEPAQLWDYLQGLGYRATLNGLPAPAYTQVGDYLWLADASDQTTTPLALSA